MFLKRLDIVGDVLGAHLTAAVNRGYFAARRDEGRPEYVFFPPERLRKNDDPGKIVKTTSYLTKLFLVTDAGMPATKKYFRRSFGFLCRIILNPNFSREISSIRQLGCCDSFSCRSRRLSASTAILFGFDRAIGDSFAFNWFC
jgi:hypothetical protein